MTITVSEEVARWARIRAAERDTSVSRLVAELLEAQMASEGEYDRARASFLGRGPETLKETGASYPARDELHERSDLR